MLGSGTPVASRTQFGSAILVETGGQTLLFDCGRGCTTRMAELDTALLPKVDHLFLTHLHSDHLTGIDDLWLNGWVLGRDRPLTIHGPEGTVDMMRHMRAAFSRDIAFRLEDRLPATDAGIAADFHDLPAGGGLVFDANGIRVTAFPVDHATVAPAYGYRIEAGGRVIVISGDTTQSADLDLQASGSDLLLLEVMSPALVHFMRDNYSPAQADRVIRSHLTSAQAARVFAAARPNLAVYYHTRNEGSFAEELISETRKIYDGPLVVAHDLMQFVVGKDRIEVRDLRP